MCILCSLCENANIKQMQRTKATTNDKHIAHLYFIHSEIHFIIFMNGRVCFAIHSWMTQIKEQFFFPPKWKLLFFTKELYRFALWHRFDCLTNCNENIFQFLSLLLGFWVGVSNCNCFACFKFKEFSIFPSMNRRHRTQKWNACTDIRKIFFWIIWSDRRDGQKKRSLMIDTQCPRKMAQRIKDEANRDGKMRWIHETERMKRQYASHIWSF